MLTFEEDAPARRIAYLAGFVLILVPVLQATTQLWPLQLGNIEWRFRAAGSMSSVLMLPFIGFAVIALVARMSDSRGIAKVVGIASLLMSLILAASLILFVLDALQLKTIVQSRAMEAFQAAAVRVGLVTLMFTVLFAVLALTSLKPPRTLVAPVRKGRKGAGDENVGLLIGQELAKAD
jgi:hypothetical protein